MMVVRGVQIADAQEIAKPTRPLASALTFPETISKQHRDVLRQATKNYGNRKILDRHFR